MKCKQCNKKFRKNKRSCSANIADAILVFCSDLCYGTYCYKNNIKIHKIKLISHKPQEPIWFDHVSKYKSFKEFKNAVIIFLSKNSFDSLGGDSFQFANHTYYPQKYQKTQILAINKVFDQLYGKNKVRWGYIYPVENNNSGLFWGPYIVIDEETFFYYDRSKLSLDEFIRCKLKNEKE